MAVTHSLRFAHNWFWNNVVNYGFGGSEGPLFAQSQLSWHPPEHRAFNLHARHLKTAYGDKSDGGDTDFYYYDS